MEITQSNYAACIARIAARGSIGHEEARALLDAVGERADEMRRTGMDDPVVAAAWELSQKLKQRADENKADALREAGIRQTRAREATEGGTTIRGAIDKLLSKLYWMPGTRDKANVQTQGRQLTHGWLSQLHAQLKKEGLLKVIGSPEMFKEIADEVWNLRSGAATATMLPSASPARKIAETIFNLQEAMRQRLNNAGARISDAKDWVATTAHDSLLIRRGGRGVAPIADLEESFRAWRDFIMPKLDEKTFEDVVVKPPMTEAFAREQFLHDVYNALRTGVHMTEHREPGGVGPAFEGTYNIARSISQGRVLLWKDAEAFSDYTGRYGKSRDWYSLMNHAAERAGRQSALMEMYGTNPSGNLNLILRRIQEQFRNSDPDGVVEFKRQANSRFGVSIDNVMQHLDGRSSIATNEMAAMIGRTVRGFYDMVYLGGVAFTHAGSLIGTFPSEGRLYGINSFESLGRLIEAATSGRIAEHEKLDVLEQLGSYGEGVSRQAFDAFAHGFGKDAPAWGVPGLVAAGHNRFMQATGLPYLFDSAKRGMREMVANKLARELPKAFDTLDAKLQQTLRSYGITQQEWELLRSGQLTQAQNGRAYLTPTAAKTIDDAAAQAYLVNKGAITLASNPDVIASSVNSLRRDLADRLAMLYEDAADHSVVTAGVREQAFLKGKMPSGSWQSELLSGIMQFKTWPIAALHQVLGREFYQSTGKTDAALGVGIVVGLSMLGGYLRMTARDVTNGDAPRVPRNIGEASKIALAALAQGGGLGIFGDFLFGEMNRMGASNLSSFGGPIFTDVSRLYEIYNRWSQSMGTDQKGDVWPELARFGLGHVPFANLFYLKGIGDYLLWYHAFEALHPGWWQRSNQQMQKQQGRTHLGYRPGAPVPYPAEALGSVFSR